MFPLLPPPRRRLRGGGRRGNGARTAHGHLIFRKNPPGAVLLPESARNRMVATAAQRLPARGLPQCGHCPQGTHASIGASYALMMHRRSLASMYLACGTKQPAITLSPTWFGNELKPAIAHAHGNRTHCPYHTRARIITVKSLTTHGLGPCNRGPLRFSPRRQTITITRLNHPDTRIRATTARRGTTWTIQSATASTKLSDRKRPRQHHSTVPPAPTSRTGIIGSVLLRRLREAETHQCTLSRTLTRQTLRPALIGFTHRHARLPAERKMLSQDTASTAPPDSRSLHTAITSRSRLLPTRPNLNPRRRETRLTPGLPRQETSTTTAQSLSLLPKTNWITRSPPSLT